MSKTDRHVVIIGGGITGVSAFISLLTYGETTQIDIVDPLPVGLGKAFATTEPMLLCNTSVDTMSILPNAPDDFLRYLLDRGLQVTLNDFVPRFYVSQYTQDRYLKYCALAKYKGIEHKHIRCQAIEIKRISDGNYHILLSDGNKLKATDVLLCQGYTEPVIPKIIQAHIGKKLLFTSPYPEKTLINEIPPQSRILLIGSRLSAIDTALLLCPQHHVTMVSASGMLPAVRSRTPRTSKKLIDSKALTSALLNLSHPLLYKRILAIVHKASFTLNALPLSKQINKSSDPVERLRAEIQLAADNHTDWQDIFVELIDTVNAVFMHKNKARQNKELENCQTFFSRYLGAFPLENANALLGYINASRLQIRSEIPTQLSLDEAWCAGWKDNSSTIFDAVVCATGFHLPSFNVKGNRLELNPHTSRSNVFPDTTPDLRVIFPDQSTPERIWIIGIASYLRVPVVNAVYSAVKQAAFVGQQFAASSNAIQAKTTTLACTNSKIYGDA